MMCEEGFMIAYAATMTSLVAIAVLAVWRG